MVKDIEALASEWSHDQRSRLLWNRESAEYLITESPFVASQFETPGQRQELDPTSGRLPSNQVCNACTELLSVIDGLRKKGKAEARQISHSIALDYTLLELCNSAKFGCHMCSLLEASLQMFINHGKPSPFAMEAERIEESWLFLSTIPNNMAGLSDQEDSRFAMTARLNNRLREATAEFTLEFHPLDEGIATDDRPIDHWSSLTSNTGDAPTFEIVGNWLRVCQETHDRCNRVRTSAAGVPRRLLRISEGQVHIVDNVENHQYVCLSHCWGSQANVPHKLTGSHRYEPFDISSLPKTFRDAIYATKYLGFEYLWVDCFCIVQGSVEDWLDQSAVMAQIYANSVFTIAALAGADTHAGCFQERNPLAIEPLLTRGLRARMCDNDTLWRLEVEGDHGTSSPLHTRAWVLQERLSAPRTVFYGSLGVYWECRCMRASETQTKLIEDNTDNTKTVLRNLHTAAKQSGEAPSTTLNSDFISQWELLLEQYTTCNLTFHSDKLIALSGITNDIQNHSGKRYILGLWHGDIATGLLWYNGHSTSIFQRVDLGGRVADIAFPSWSWASVVGRIKHFRIPGEVTWTPNISIEEGPRISRLHMTTWMRDVDLDEDDEESLVLSDDGSRRGDLTDTHVWFPDDAKQTEVPLRIALVQRVLITKQPFIGAVRCLVVTIVEGNVYRRVGMTVIRFGKPKYDPFPADAPVAGKQDIILI